MELAGKQIAVLGAGGSGYAAAALALSRGASVRVFDSGAPEKLAAAVAKFEALGAPLTCGEAALTPPHRFDLVVLSPGIDTDGDGEATSADTPYVEQDGYVSGVAVTAYGTVLYGSATPDDGGSVVETIRTATDPFMGTATVAWMEMY